jgi:hypothetical protein
MSGNGNSLIVRARSFAGRAVRRGAPVERLEARVNGLEQSLADLWRISEEMRAAIDDLRATLERQLPDLGEDIDRRIAVHDEARAEEIQALESVRRRIQELEAARDASG